VETGDKLFNKILSNSAHVLQLLQPLLPDRSASIYNIRTRSRDKLLIERDFLVRMLYQWQQKIRNEEVKKRIGANRNVFQIIIQRKLQFFGHICRMKDARIF